MQAYQLGIAKFGDSDSVVFAISTDNVPSQKEFANKLGLTFPLLSDFVRPQSFERLWRAHSGARLC